MMPGKSDLLRDIGEKAIVRDLIKPLLNPEGSENSVGDDCAVIPIGGDLAFCASTDRVPSDLVSFRLGILDYEGLGRYLAVLNLSDLAAMGATASGLLLNLGLPPTLLTSEFISLLRGAREACAKVGCAVVGGDLSSASELSISATSLGVVELQKVLRRAGAQPGDCAYCSDVVGLTATAFAYFLQAEPAGYRLSAAEEAILKDCFRAPRPRFDVGHALAACGYRVTAMDNTDGVAQSLSEIAEAGRVGIILSAEVLPIHDISRRVADHLNIDVIDLVLGPGADFQLIGTCDPAAIQNEAVKSLIRPIGYALAEPGFWLETSEGGRTAFAVRGWDYYAEVERSHTSRTHDSYSS
jgi:thiamine-monophosphate kinase